MNKIKVENLEFFLGWILVFLMLLCLQTIIGYNQQKEQLKVLKQIEREIDDN